MSEFSASKESSVKFMDDFKRDFFVLTRGRMKRIDFFFFNVMIFGVGSLLHSGLPALIIGYLSL